MLCRFGTTCYLYYQRFVPHKQDVLLAFQQSNVIYPFSCHCDSWYIGCTFQRMQDRIKHIPKSIRNATCFQTRNRISNQNMMVNLQLRCLTTHSLSCDSAIGLHLLDGRISPAIPPANKLQWQTIFYSCQRSLSLPFICLRSHFH